MKQSNLTVAGERDRHLRLTRCDIVLHVPRQFQRIGVRSRAALRAKAAPASGLGSGVSFWRGRSNKLMD